DKYWQIFSSLHPLLFESVGRSGYSRLKLPVADIKAAIFNHVEFTAFNASVTTLFSQWKAANALRFAGLAKGDHPKALIETLSEDLLETFQKVRLIDPYDIYQHLMDYWAETMQDDVYMIVSDGWQEGAKPRLIIEDKDRKTKEKPDFTVGKQKFKADLIPVPVLIACYFPTGQAAIERLESEAAAIVQSMEEMAEEHGSEEGLLAEVKNDKGKVTRAAVTARIKEIKDNAEFADELNVLKEYLALIEKEADAVSRIKDAQKDLEAKVAAKYGKLSEDEIKTLVVDDKWLATIAAAVQSELDHVSQTLTGRIRELADRYATPLPKLTGEVETLAARVDEHLKKMGAVWN
ncbi:MAG: type I restriction endonuclease subunit M, partial [bacterium]